MSALDQVREEEEREAARLAALHGYELDDTEPPPAVQTSALAIAKADAQVYPLPAVGTGVPVQPRSLLEQLGRTLWSMREGLELAEDEEAWEREHCIEVSESTKAHLRQARDMERELLALAELVKQLSLPEQLKERPLTEAP